MAVLKKYQVRVPQQVYLVFNVTAESPLAAKNIALAGEAEEAHQETAPISESDFSALLDKCLVQELSN